MTDLICTRCGKTGHRASQCTVPVCCDELANGNLMPEPWQPVELGAAAVALVKWLAWTAFVGACLAAIFWGRA